MSRPTCETCPFWVKFPLAPPKGECHHAPPILGESPFYASKFPPMYASDFCGAHPEMQAYVDESKKPARCEPWPDRCQEDRNDDGIPLQCLHKRGHGGPHQFAR